MDKMNDQKFIKNFTGQIILYKNDILQDSATPAASKNFKFKSYGTYKLVFYPNFKFTNTGWACVIMFSGQKSFLNPDTPSFDAIYKFSFSEDGTTWTEICDRTAHVCKVQNKFGFFLLRKSFYDEFPQTKDWIKIFLKFDCCFTKPEHRNFVDDQYFRSYEFLKQYNQRILRSWFCYYSELHGKIDSANVDGTICYIESFLGAWIRLPVHKKALTSKSKVFAKMFKKCNSIDISLEFRDESITEDAIAFCYIGALSSYNKELLKFAKYYEIQSLIEKIDVWYAKKVEKTKTMKYQTLLNEYDLPMLAQAYAELEKKKKSSDNKCHRIFGKVKKFIKGF